MLILADFFCYVGVIPRRNPTLAQNIESMDKDRNVYELCGHIDGITVAVFHTCAQVGDLMLSLYCGPSSYLLDDHCSLSPFP